jgi:monoamine oxidase
MASGLEAGTHTPFDLTPSADDRCLEIGVIGAGIAGLGAAIALGQAGHNVEVGTEASCCFEVASSRCRGRVSSACNADLFLLTGL